MSDHDLEPLAPELRRLIDAGGEGARPMREVQERILARVQATVALPAAPDPGADPGAGPAAATTTGLLAKPLVVGLATFVLGMGAGAGLLAGVQRLRPPPAPPARMVAPVPPPSNQPASAPSRRAEVVPRPGVTPPSAVRTRNGSPNRELPRDVQLAAERSVLEMARTALGRGDGGGALASVRQHERDFPRGRLIEEREALRVQALAAAGRVAEALTAGTRFRAAYPRSLFRPVVEAALKSVSDTDPLAPQQ